MDDVVLRDEADGAATLTLNRPAKRNALDIEVFQALEGFLDDIAARTGEIGVVMVRGAGSCFSAGADISRPPRRVGPYKAREMMFTAREYDGREAEAMGLAALCAPGDELDAAVAGLVQAIVAGSWFSHREHKRVLLRTDGMTLAEGDQ